MPSQAKPKTILIIGATSGIGEALVRQYAINGDTVIITGRRSERLEALQKDLGATACFTYPMDVRNTSESLKRFVTIINQHKKLDSVIISAGTGYLNHELAPAKELETLNTNVNGFVAMACAAYNHFKETGSGHLVGISSICALYGSDCAPAYNASKACVSNYMDGLYHKARKEKQNIHITDIRPGFVDTAMAQGDTFWMATTEKAARQIINAINNKKKIAYITKRWNIIAFLITWFRPAVQRFL